MLDCVNHHDTLGHLTMTLRKWESTSRTPRSLLQHEDPEACHPEQRLPRGKKLSKYWHFLSPDTCRELCFTYVVSLNSQQIPMWSILLLLLCYEKWHWSTENLNNLPQTTQVISEEPKLEPTGSDGRDYGIWFYGRGHNLTSISMEKDAGPALKKALIALRAP